MVIKQYGIYFFDPAPVIGSEINKIRPCLVVSIDKINHNLSTVWVVPITSNIREDFKFRIIFTNKNNELNALAIDHLRSIDKKRLINKVGKIDDEIIITRLNENIKLFLGV